MDNADALALVLTRPIDFRELRMLNMTCSTVRAASVAGPLFVFSSIDRLLTKVELGWFMCMLTAYGTAIRELRLDQMPHLFWPVTELDETDHEHRAANLRAIHAECAIIAKGLPTPNCAFQLLERLVRLAPALETLSLDRWICGSEWRTVGGPLRRGATSPIGHFILRMPALRRLHVERLGSKDFVDVSGCPLLTHFACDITADQSNILTVAAERVEQLSLHKMSDVQLGALTRCTRLKWLRLSESALGTLGARVAHVLPATLLYLDIADDFNGVSIERDCLLGLRSLRALPPPDPGL